MAMSRDAFIARWKKHVAGMALFGAVSELRDGPIARAVKILDIPQEVEKLLGQMYDDLCNETPLENHRPKSPGDTAVKRV